MNVIEEPAQVGLLPVVNAMLTAGAVGVVVATVIELEVAGLPSTLAKLDVITQLTTSPATGADRVNTLEFVPALTPFTFH